MYMTFEFATAGRIMFGAGSSAALAPLARNMGSKVLVVTGRKPDMYRSLMSGLTSEKLPFVLVEASGEPSIDDVRQSSRQGRTAGCDLVVGIGGGRVIDLAKATAAILTNPGDPLDYLEVIGQGQPLGRPSAPCIAIPTTAGTGSEVTRNAVLASPEHAVKVSMRHPSMLPVLALVDPELTVSMPPALTASTGMDALTQLLEAFISIKANPMTDAVCREGLPRAIGALGIAYRNGLDRTARTDMALASLMGGLALANAGLGAVHGYAAVIGGALPIAHGAICAALLPQTMSVNLAALKARCPDSPALTKLAEFARMTGGSTMDDGICWLKRICHELAIPRLARFGLRAESIPGLAAKARQSSSMKGNPLVLSDTELNAILEDQI
jgi:alcohol dehydrogenase class IV